MKASLSSSELILNADGSIYHLNLLPEDIADIIITVGDPERVSEVSKHFDSVEIKKGKRSHRLDDGLVIFTEVKKTGKTTVSLFKSDTNQTNCILLTNNSPRMIRSFTSVALWTSIIKRA